ncbi:MAG: HIT family protein [bacterium]
MSCCNIWEKFDEPNLLIKEYKHWKLLLKGKNYTLGNCYAITKQHHEWMSEVSAEEMAEFVEVSKDLERALKASFNFDNINYLVLMRYDKHTHFHIFPRYEKPRQFAGREWRDIAYPGLMGIKFESQDIPTPDVIKQVIQEIQKNI